MTLLYNNIIIIAVCCRFIEDKILNVLPQQESVLLSQLADSPRQVLVLLQPGDTLAVEREDLQGRDRVWK